MTACQCRCHVSSGAYASCTVDAGYGIGCGPHDLANAVPQATPCVIDGLGDSRYGLVCTRHYHWIGDTLTQLEELWALRDDVLVHISGPRYDKDGGSATPDGSPAPGRIGVMALSDSRMRNNQPMPMTYERNWNGRTLETNGDDVVDVPGVLFSWVRMIGEEQQRKVGMDGTLTGSVRFLRQQRPWIVAQAWVDDYATELHEAHRALAGALGAGMWPRSIGRCPNCQARLYNTIGMDEVTCRRCKSTWGGVHLARLRLIHEQEQERRQREARQDEPA